MDEQLRADLARRMGMKARELLDVAEVDGGYLVTTHDGHKTLVRADGTFTSDVAPLVALTAAQRRAAKAAEEPRRAPIKTTATVGKPAKKA